MSQGLRGAWRAERGELSENPNRFSAQLKEVLL